MQLRAFLPLMAIFFLYYAARGISILVIPLYLDYIGLPIVQIGIVFAVNGVSVLLFEVMWGFVLDRVGAAKTMPVVVALTAGTYLLFPFVHTVESAIAVGLIFGISTPAMAVVTRALIVEQGEASEWGGGFGLLGSIFSFSLMFGSFMGGVSSSLVGLADTFYVATTLSLSSYLVYRVLRGDDTRHERRAPPETVLRAGPGSEWRFDWRGLPLLGLVAVPLFMGQAFFTTIVPVIMTKTRPISASPFETSIMLVLYYLSLAVFQPIMGSRGTPRARTWIAVGLLGNFGVLLAMTQALSVAEVSALAFLAGLCFSIVSPLSLSLLMVGIPKRYVGRAMGIYGAAEDVGMIFGPLIGSVVWAQLGLEASYVVEGLPFVMVLAVYLVSLRGSPTLTKR